MVDKSEEWTYCVRPGQLILWVHANEENLEDPHEIAQSPIAAKWESVNGQSATWCTGFEITETHALLRLRKRHQVRKM